MRAGRRVTCRWEGGREDAVVYRKSSCPLRRLDPVPRSCCWSTYPIVCVCQGARYRHDCHLVLPTSAGCHPWQMRFKKHVCKCLRMLLGVWHLASHRRDVLYLTFWSSNETHLEKAPDLIFSLLLQMSATLSFILYRSRTIICKPLWIVCKPTKAAAMNALLTKKAFITLCPQTDFLSLFRPFCLAV